jgi:hypothetical protein
MGCTSNVTLGGVSYNCDDVPYGGLKKVLLANKADIESNVTVDSSTGLVTVTAAQTAGTIVELNFSNKDAFTAWEETKTVDPTGSVKAEGSLSIEFPKMDKAKRDELDKITVPYAKLVIFMEDAAGEYRMAGYEFGAIASEAKGQTGNGRGEKNVYQLKLTTDESHMSYSITAADFANIEAGVA